LRLAAVRIVHRFFFFFLQFPFFVRHLLIVYTLDPFGIESDLICLRFHNGLCVMGKQISIIGEICCHLHAGTAVTVLDTRAEPLLHMDRWLVETREGGRYVVAPRPIPRGACVLATRPFAWALQSDFRKSRCVRCLAALTPTSKGRAAAAAANDMSSTTAPIPCAHCRQVAYCSADCYETHAGPHAAHGECAVLQALARMKPKEAQSASLLALCVARCVGEGIALPCHPSEGTLVDIDAAVAAARAGNGSGRTAVLDAVASTLAEDPGRGFGLWFLDPSASASESAAAALAHSSESTPAEFCALVSNVEGFTDKEVQEMTSVIATYHRLAAAVAASGDAAMRRFIPPRVDCGLLLRILCAFDCNAFGIWNKGDKCTATAVVPTASFFNHNCAPNVLRKMFNRTACFFALRDIAAGEALCICYVDADWARSDRVEYLEAHYKFRCGCARCALTTAAAAAQEQEGTAVDDHTDAAPWWLASCQYCVGGYLRPIVAAPPLRDASAAAAVAVSDEAGGGDAEAVGECHICSRRQVMALNFPTDASR
jgi:hypothetical protein